MARSLRALWRHTSLFQWGQCHIYPLVHPASFSDLIQDVIVRCSGASGPMGSSSETAGSEVAALPH